MEIRKIKKKNPRIAMLIDRWFPFYSGEQVHVAKLAESFTKEHGFEVDIITRSFKGSLRKEEAEIEKIPELRVKRFGRTRMVYLVRTFVHLLLSRKKYKLYHAHSATAALAMKVASWFTRVPTIVTVHANRVFDKAWTLKKILHRVLLLETKYSQEISTSEQFLKAKNVNSPILVVPNGIDVEPFDEVKVERNPEQFNVIFVGPLLHVKGVDVLLRATKRLAESSEFIQSRKDFRLHIVGDGPERKRLEKLAGKLEIENFVKFHGKVTKHELIKLYKSSDLFVLPSRAEGLSYILLQACAAKLPILATNVGDNRKLVLENTNGHLVHPTDADEFAYYMEQFVFNPQLEAMGQASYEIVTQEYDWTDTIAKNLRVYESLISKKKKKKTEVKHVDAIMPWQIPSVWWKQRKFNRPYRGRLPLKFCFTVNVEAAHATTELPHEVDHVLPFLEKFSDFSASLEIPSTLFFQSELIEPFYEELLAMQKAGHEIGLLATLQEWQNGPDRKKALRSYPDWLKDLGVKKIRMFRAPGAIGEEDLDLIHDAGFEHLPVSEDPRPFIHWHYGVLPFGRSISMNLKNFLQMTEQEVLEAVNRLRFYHTKHRVAPFLIFECNSWEFQSRVNVDYAGGENFTELSKRIAFLREHMDLEFQTLSDFCKSCSVPA